MTTPDSQRFDEDDRVTLLPEAGRGSLFDAIEKARTYLREQPKAAQILEGDKQAVLTRDLVRAITQIGDEDALAIIEKHLREYPNDPEGGFDTLSEYGRYLSSMNAVCAAEKALFKANPDALRMRDPENPDKFVKKIVVECADGRNSALLFIPQDKLLSRFDLEYLPAAGEVMFPDVELPRDPSELEKLFAENPRLKAHVFDRLDKQFGPAVAEAIRDHENGILDHAHIEFQSHFDSHNENHGCGKHNSNLTAAQLETIKDCEVTELWLKEDRYLKLFEAGFFRLYRTTHANAHEGHVYRAAKVDERLPEETRTNWAAQLNLAHSRYEHLSPEQPEKHIVQKYISNPAGVETAEHAEQIVRISNAHLASTLKGQSVLEISWSNDPSILFDHTKILLGIIDRNFRAHHSDKPAILHFDLVAGDAENKQVYDRLFAMVISDPDLKKAILENRLLLWTTATDRDTFKMGGVS